MIPIKKESEMLYKEFGVYEVCVFCEQKTDTWHEKTNNPVCKPCSKVHKVSELTNHFKSKK